MTPYEDMYVKKPLSIVSYVLGNSKVDAVDNTLHNKESILCTLKDNLAMAQNRMKQQVGQHRSKRSFEEGDQVFLHLQPYK